MRTQKRFGPGALLLAALLPVCHCGDPQRASPSDSARKLRMEMVERQIAQRGIRDTAVLRAMRTVPRHQFVEAGDSANAYDDHPLPIGYGQTISQPYIVALMTELARPNSSSRVLEIGTGSGYQAAVLAEIADSVFTVEIVEPLADAAAERLRRMAYGNVVVRCGDGYLGWKEKSPFDAILVTAAAPEIPRPLLEQLAEGGRMVIPYGEAAAVQQLLLLEKRNGRISKQEILPVRFVPLVR